jgi:hypothetical protein
VPRSFEGSIWEVFEDKESVQPCANICCNWTTWAGLDLLLFTSGFRVFLFLSGWAWRLRQDLGKMTRLALNTQSCLSLQNARITGMYHHSQLYPGFGGHEDGAESQDKLIFR